MSDSYGIEKLPIAVLLAPLLNDIFGSVEEVSVANRCHYAEDIAIEMIEIYVPLVPTRNSKCKAKR